MGDKHLVGVAGPMSGPRASYGEMLADESKRRKGLDVNFLIADDRADPQRARFVAADFIARKVLCVIGHPSSECAVAAGELYRAAGIPVLLPASTGLQLRDNKYLFRLCPDDAEQVDAISQLGDNLVAIWSDGSAYADRICQLFKDRRKVGALKSAGSRRSLIYLGAYHRIAEQLTSDLPLDGSRIVCCDDCACERFARLVEGVALSICIEVIAPTPDYQACIGKSFEILDAYLQSRPHEQLLDWLQEQRDLFTDNKLVGTRFTVTPISTLYRSNRNGEKE